jgi:hypothetical protein
VFAFNKKPDKKTSFFGVITENLRFESDEDKQSDNTGPEGEQKDAQLDAQLSELKDQKNDEGTTGNGPDESETPEGGTPPGDTTDPVAGDDNAMPGDTADSAENDDGIDKSEGKANRRSEVFNSFNFINNTVKDSIKRLQRVASTNADFNDCIAHLQSISKDMDFFTKRFMNYSAEDAFVQLELFKQKIELQMERLKRLNSTKE